MLSAAADAGIGTVFALLKSDRCGQKQMMTWGADQGRGYFACLCRTWYSVALNLE